MCVYLYKYLLFLQVQFLSFQERFTAFWDNPGEQPSLKMWGHWSAKETLYIYEKEGKQTPAVPRVYLHFIPMPRQFINMS